MLQELKAAEKYKSLFSLDYLSNIVKSANEDITIYLGNDNPMQVEFDFAGKNGHVVYLLAPRIEAE